MAAGGGAEGRVAGDRTTTTVGIGGAWESERAGSKSAMGGRPYSEDKKAQVMAALLMGQSISSVARDYKIPRTTINEWAAASDEYRHFSSQKKERIGTLLLDYISASLETLRLQVEQFSDPTWIKKQSASEVAVLHGVVADKTVRLLEALAPEHDEGDESASTTGE